MKRPNLITALLCALLVALTASASVASKAQDMFDKAMRAVQRAERPGLDKADRNDAYEAAVKKLSQVADKYGDRPQGVRALYEVGRIYELPRKTTKLHDPNKAYETYKGLVARYKPGGKFDDKALSEEDYETEEIDQIKKTVNLAEEGEKRTADLLDKENSKDWKYQILDFFVRITGKVSWFSYWFAIIVVTLIVKILITPLTKAQFKAMKEMQKVTPLVKQIQEEYKGDQRTIGEKTMQLYKDHHINPFASCLPILIQMPILFLLYGMINSYKFQFQNGTFLWIGSPLSGMFHFPVMGNTVWVTAANLAQADAILVVLYLISMYISTKMSAVDPTQADQQKMMAIMMPVMFAFIFAGFPSAFLLYWLVFNVIQTIQQYLILHGGQQEAAALAPSLPPDSPEEPGEGGDEGDGPDRVRRRRRRR